VIFLMFALFLFSHRMMLTIQKIGLSKRLRLLSLLSSLLIAVPVMLLTDLGLPFTRIIMVASLYLLLFDLYIDEQRPSLVWLGTWLVFFASFAAVLLFKYNEDKDLVTRLEYAKELAKWEDPYAEEEFDRLTSVLEEDPLIVKLLFSDSLQRAAGLKQLEKQIDNVYSNHSYLFNIYSYSFAIEAAGDTTAGKTRFLDAD